MNPSRVYLVRHAEAEKDTGGGDAARRLTPEGRARFIALAGALARKVSISRIVTSPFARAHETAEILATATGAPLEDRPELAPGRSSGRDILALARGAGEAVALVGHNPEIAEAISLAAGVAQKVRAGAVAAVELHETRDELGWIEAPGEQ